MIEEKEKRRKREPIRRLEDAVKEAKSRRPVIAPEGLRRENGARCDSAHPCFDHLLTIGSQS